MPTKRGGVSNRGDSSGVLVLVVGVVLGVLNLVATSGRDSTSALVLGVLALAALAANLFLRQGASRPASIDLAFARAVLLVFGGAFVLERSGTLAQATVTRISSAAVRLTRRRSDVRVR